MAIKLIKFDQGSPIDQALERIRKGLGVGRKEVIVWELLVTKLLIEANERRSVILVRDAK